MYIVEMENGRVTKHVRGIYSDRPAARSAIIDAGWEKDWAEGRIEILNATEYDDRLAEQRSSR